MKAGESRENRNARHGLRLFAVYLLLYSGFMGLSAFFPEASGWMPFGGVNLAILYGLALILAAVVLAFVYAVLCRGETPPAEGERGPEEGPDPAGGPHPVEGPDPVGGPHPVEGTGR